MHDSPSPSATGSSRPHLFGVLAGLALAGALCFAALVASHTWIRLGESQTVNVTGSARKNITSDLVVWSASFSTEAAELLQAHAQLRADLVKVTSWLATNGASEIVTKPISITEVTAQYREGETYLTKRVGYRLKQEIEVRSNDVALIPRLGGECTELIAQGVLFVSDQVQFIYTKAADAKIEMMAEATRDARARAEQIAEQGGRKIRELRTARMGVVQINPLHSTATSWDGNNDTGALEKTIIVTMNAVFSLE
jgi:uncharacterized protein